MLQQIVLFCHLGVALLIIALVLLQRGKGADAGTGFGAGASGTVFGSRGTASFFSRATAVLATIFFMTSLALAWLGGQQSAPESLLDSLESPAGISIQPPPSSEVDDSGLPGVLESAPPDGTEPAAAENAATGDAAEAVPAAEDE
ncbi:MAG TPA: preprotein translocase subunit SecG [Gammaproteobacteria bacterium]|nr:preprotein translocase subunit SecG [Gammaproteobacteria bacterium]